MPQLNGWLEPIQLGQELVDLASEKLLCYLWRFQGYLVRNIDGAKSIFEAVFLGVFIIHAGIIEDQHWFHGLRAAIETEKLGVKNTSFDFGVVSGVAKVLGLRRMPFIWWIRSRLCRLLAQLQLTRRIWHLAWVIFFRAQYTFELAKVSAHVFMEICVVVTTHFIYQLLFVVKAPCKKCIWLGISRVRIILDRFLFYYFRWLFLNSEHRLVVGGIRSRKQRQWHFYSKNLKI